MRKFILVLVGLLMVAPVVSAQVSPYGTFVKVTSPGGYHNGLFFINDRVGYSVAGSAVDVTQDSSRTWVEHSILYPQFSFGHLTAVWADTTAAQVVRLLPSM
jgi:hypothetical protein